MAFRGQKRIVYRKVYSMESGEKGAENNFDNKCLTMGWSMGKMPSVNLKTLKPIQNKKSGVTYPQGGRALTCVKAPAFFMA